MLTKKLPQSESLLGLPHVISSVSPTIGYEIKFIFNERGHRVFLCKINESDVFTWPTYLCAWGKMNAVLTEKLLMEEVCVYAVPDATISN